MKNLLLAFLLLSGIALAQGPGVPPRVRALPGGCALGDIVSLINTDVNGNPPGLYITTAVGPPCVWQAVTGVTTQFAGVPTGTCTATQLAVNTTNGNLYACNAGTWLQAGGGGAGFPITSAQVVNAGGSIAPGAGSVLGTIRANQEAWTIGPTNASFYEAMSTTGGTISAPQTVITQITYNTSAGGETLPSILPSSSNTLPANCSSGSTCSYLLSSYPIPPGYTGYTVYTCATSTSCTPLKYTGCINITTSCTITASGTGAGVPTSNTAYLAQPTPVGTNTCPPNASPWLYVNDGTSWFNYIGVDSTNTGTNPPAPYNKLVFCRPVWMNDSGVDPPAGRNAYLNIFHVTNGTVVNAGNQDRSQFNFTTNCATDLPCGDTINHWGMEGIQAQTDWFDTTGGSNFGHPDSEVAGGSFQASDFHTTVGAVGPALGVTGTRSTSYRQAGATSFSNACTYCWLGVEAIAQNNSTASGSGQYMAAFTANCAEASGAASNINCIGLQVAKLGTWTNLWGININDMGSTAATFNFDSDAGSSAGGRNYFEGSTFLNHISTTGPNRNVVNPTSCASTGTGTGPSCAFDTGSTDTSGTLTVTAGTTPGASGTITITYQATLGANSSNCVMMPSNAGTGAWNARVSLIGGTMNTTSAVVNWDNNAANLTAAATYKVNFWCTGK